MSERGDFFCAVVVTFHTGPALQSCLSALLEQLLCRQLVIVNNGNPQQTLAELERLAAQDERVRVLDGHGNIGFGAGCNLGATKSYEGLLAFVNPDCMIDEATLPAFLSTFGDFPDALLGGALRNIDGSEQRGCRRGKLTIWSALVSFTGLGRVGEEAGLWRDFNRNREPAPLSPVDMPVVSGALMAMSKSAFDRLGGFDPAYFLHVEDIDLCQRVRDQGGRVIYVPAATGFHIGGTSKASKWVVEKAKITSFFYYFWTHANGFLGHLLVLATMPVLMFAIIARMLISISVSGRAGQRPPQ